MYSSGKDLAGILKVENDLVPPVWSRVFGPVLVPLENSLKIIQ
jgi:hypothetical protein